MKMIKISIIVPKAISDSVIADLFAMGIRHLFVETGRNSLLDKSKGFTNIFSHRALISYPIEILSLFVKEDDEIAVLSYISIKYDLRSPGKGSIYSQEIGLEDQHPDYLQRQEIHFKAKQNQNFYTQLVGVSCIVQRGDGEKITRISLNYGASVPATTYGEGSGARDRLGLLRITIPPEKELINLVLSKHDTDAVMELYIAEGKLDEAGRGIAYVYPIRRGIVDTKIARTRTNQAASVEQMVSAIDSLKGGMEWRKSSLERETPRRRNFLIHLTEINLICEEGRGTQLTEAAMRSGAPGATICKLRYQSLDDELNLRRYAREVCKMIVPTSQVQAIAQSLRKTGCFEDSSKALLFTLPVQKAFTYRAQAIRKARR